MDTRALGLAIAQAVVDQDDHMKVYTTNDGGGLVEVTDSKVVIMRDEMDVPIFVLERK